MRDDRGQKSCKRMIVKGDGGQNFAKEHSEGAIFWPTKQKLCHIINILYF